MTEKTEPFNIRIPRSVRVWLFLLGFWGGMLTSIITAFHIIAWFGCFVASIILWGIIASRYGSVLEKWGLVKRETKKNETEASIH